MNKKVRVDSDVFVCQVDKGSIVLAGFVCQLDTSWSYHKERSLFCLHFFMAVSSFYTTDVFQTFKTSLKTMREPLKNYERKM